jgi:hypothetical protein
MKWPEIRMSRAMGWVVNSGLTENKSVAPVPEFLVMEKVTAAALLGCHEDGGCREASQIPASV